MDLVSLLPSFGNVIWTLAAFVVALSVIVAIHEFGHYIVGRWSGIDAEVFSLGFGPVLFSRMDRRGTRWQVAALPLGGYVRFLGDADPASAGADDEVVAAMTEDTRRRTMQGAPLWARAATVAAGPFFNFALSILVFAAVLTLQGVASEPLTVGAVRQEVPGAAALEAGDRILSIDGEVLPDVGGLDAVLPALPEESPLDYEVERDGERLVVAAPHPLPPLVAGVTPGSAAADVGLGEGDLIVAIEGEPAETFADLRDAVAASEGRPVLLEAMRDGERLEIVVVPRRTDVPTQDGGFETRWLVGISGGLLFEPQTRTPGPLSALGYGVEQTAFIVESSLSGLWHMAAGAISSCNLSGPIGIAQTSGAAASQGWLSFVWFIAVLSTAVGLLNLFPIPILDGGHLVFHAYEAVSGRPPSDRALRVLMAMGLAFLLTLMAFALTNDLFCP
ncbi:RIP metalloprotease RseP [Roseitranquillus sediminis]|uniref:RIP metalloprotease RseP n=1 Tax=Roseitranquillus sediminis TaxID=2809051 RepID=UPI001D0CDB66|nr:RIP metalloprotease RseP [Roseitranquillus sediminis]MBM9595638.1 RIP metalloprotease RseP [Roseitranquillus sediminis]